MNNDEFSQAFEARLNNNNWNQDIASKVLIKKHKQNRQRQLIGIGLIITLGLSAYLMNIQFDYLNINQEMLLVNDFEEWYYFEFITSLVSDTITKLI